MGRTPKKTPKALAKALADMNEAAIKQYGSELKVGGKNRNQAEDRLRHVVGVVMKKDFSDEQQVRKGGKVIDVKWVINPEKLAAMPDDAWQLQVLMAGDPKRAREIAQNLKHEMRFQRHFFKIMHPYLCPTPEMTDNIGRILQEYGLGEYAKYTSPKKLAGVGSVALFAYLSGVITTIPAGAVALATLAICGMGLKKICKKAEIGDTSAR
jgi:hypothetical protein